MPKREKTPSPGARDFHYLTVVHPYPPAAHLEVLDDSKQVVYWLACITGAENLVALYHRHVSPNIIIIEVKKECQNIRGLLGKHEWAGILKGPSPQDMHKCSKIYFCTYATDREVQKNGWRRVDVRDHWFKQVQWDPTNCCITYPYPPSSYCELPQTEDRTNGTLCRRLPVAMHPPPASKPLPPVGSAAWSSAKASDPASKNAKPSAWSNGAPISVKIAKSTKANNVATPITDGVNKWNLGVPSSLLTAVTHTLDEATSPPARPDTSSSPRSPSGLPPLRKAPTPASAGELPDLQRRYSSASSNSSPWPVTPSPGDGDDFLRDAPRSWADDPVDTTVIIEGTQNLGIADEDSAALPVMYGSNWATQALGSNAPPPPPAQENDNTDLWAQERDGAKLLPAETERFCSIHGKYKLCPRGICKEYAAEQKRLEREKKAQEETNQRGRFGGKRARGKSGRGGRGARGGGGFREGGSDTSAWCRVPSKRNDQSTNAGVWDNNDSGDAPKDDDGGPDEQSWRMRAWDNESTVAGTEADEDWEPVNKNSGSGSRGRPRTNSNATSTSGWGAYSVGPY